MFFEKNTRLLTLLVRLEKCIPTHNELLKPSGMDFSLVFARGLQAETEEPRPNQSHLRTKSKQGQAKDAKSPELGRPTMGRYMSQFRENILLTLCQT